MTTAADELVGRSQRRVKVYILNEENAWEDNGTGHVAYHGSDDGKTTSLVVRSETDGIAANTFLWHSCVIISTCMLQVKLNAREINLKFEKVWGYLCVK